MFGENWQFKLHAKQQANEVERAIFNPTKYKVLTTTGTGEYKSHKHEQSLLRGRIEFGKKWVSAVGVEINAQQHTSFMLAHSKNNRVCESMLCTHQETHE